MLSISTLYERYPGLPQNRDPLFRNNDPDQVVRIADPVTFEPYLKITNTLIPSTNGIFLPIERKNITDTKTM